MEKYEPYTISGGQLLDKRLFCLKFYLQSVIDHENLISNRQWAVFFTKHQFNKYELTSFEAKPNDLRKHRSFSKMWGLKIFNLKAIDKNLRLFRPNRKTGNEIRTRVMHFKTRHAAEKRFRALWKKSPVRLKNFIWTWP